MMDFEASLGNVPTKKVSEDTTDSSFEDSLSNVPEVSKVKNTKKQQEIANYSKRIEKVKKWEDNFALRLVQGGSKLSGGILPYPDLSGVMERNLKYMQDETSIMDQVHQEASILGHKVAKSFLGAVQWIPARAVTMGLVTTYAETAKGLMEGEVWNEAIIKGAKKGLFVAGIGKFLEEARPIYYGLRAASKEAKVSPTLLTDRYLQGEFGYAVTKEMDKGASFLGSEIGVLAKGLENRYYNLDSIVAKELVVKSEEIAAEGLRVSRKEKLQGKKAATKQEARKQTQEAIMAQNPYTPTAKFIKETKAELEAQKQLKDAQYQVRKNERDMAYREAWKNNPFTKQVLVAKETVEDIAAQEALKLKQAKAREARRSLEFTEAKQSAITDIKAKEQIIKEAELKQKETDYNVNRELMISQVAKQQPLRALVLINAQRAAKSMAGTLGDIGKKLSGKYNELLSKDGIGDTLITGQQEWSNGETKDIATHILDELSKIYGGGANTVSGAIDNVANKYGISAPWRGRLEAAKISKENFGVLAEIPEPKIPGFVDKYGKSIKVPAEKTQVSSGKNFALTGKDIHQVIQVLETIGDKMMKQPVQQEEALNIIFKLKKELRNSLENYLKETGGTGTVTSYKELDTSYAKWAGLYDDFVSMGGKAPWTGEKYIVGQGVNLTKKLEKSAVDKYLLEGSMVNTAEEDVQLLKDYLNASVLPYKQYNELIEQARKHLPDSVATVERNMNRLWSSVKEEQNFLKKDPIPAEYIPPSAHPELEKAKLFLKDIQDLYVSESKNLGVTKADKELANLFRSQGVDYYKEMMLKQSTAYAEKIKSEYAMTQSKLSLEQAKLKEAYTIQQKGLDDLYRTTEKNKTDWDISHSEHYNKRQAQHRLASKSTLEKNEATRQNIRNIADDYFDQATQTDKNNFWSKVANRAHLIQQPGLRLIAKTAAEVAIFAPLIGETVLLSASKYLMSLGNIVKAFPDSKQARVVSAYIEHYMDNLRKNEEEKKKQEEALKQVEDQLKN